MHERLSINSICFPGASLAQVMMHWRRLGARRVSVLAALLNEDEGSAVHQALGAQDSALESVMQPYLPPGQHLDAPAAKLAGASDRFSELITAATRLGAQSIYTVAGGHGALTWEDAAERFCRSFAPCVRAAHDSGIKLMVENSPSLYADVHIAHTLHDAVELSELAGIGVVIDVFGCWTEAGLQQTLRRAVPRCQLVQLSDYVYGDRSLPARAVPGDGAIPLPRILDWILQAGYRGVFDLELVGPRIDREGHLEATQRAAESVSNMLHSLGA